MATASVRAKCTLFAKPAALRHLLLTFCFVGLLAAVPLRAQTVTADFGNHSDPLALKYPIPSEIVGAQYSNNSPRLASAMTSLYNGGFRRLRMHGFLQVVYTTQTANWSQLDSYLDAVKGMNVGKNPGFKVTLELTYTPPWLIPAVPGCPQPGQANSYKVPPTDVNTWAQLAKSMVAHVDQKYPGMVTDFEIWNEPELGTFCTNPNDSTTRLNRYLAIYAATAPLIRQQLAADGQTGRIGGPTIVSTGAISQWIGGLVNNASTAPYVDFVSYHKYPSGQSDIDNGMLWDQTSPAGTASLYSRIQAPNNLGFLQNYLSIANTVKAGKQPNPTQTKIYMDEYNDNWAFSTDCCRNSTTYSPLFNGLAMVDMLNAVYSGAPHVPDSLEYYSASNQPFCLVGDSGLQCGTSNFNTFYPQYYLYSLFASPNYLNLVAGSSFMAKSIAPGATTSGLAATAFWSGNQDSIVIVNPTSTAFGSVAVSAVNPGIAVGNVTEYLLNSTNRTITSISLPASANVNVSVPAYSVVALKFTAIAGPDFTVTASPASQTVAPGGSTTYSVAVNAVNGFTGSVTFAASGLPTGTTASFNPSSVNGSGSSTMTVNTTSQTPTGTYPITITAISGALQHTTQVSLVVFSTDPDFSVSASPPSQNVAPGNSANYSVAVNAVNGFTGSVTFAASGLPAGATASFNPSSVNGSGSSTMTVNTTSLTPTGTYPITITATSGTLQHTTQVSLIVRISDFSLSVSPASRTIAQNTYASYSVTVIPQGGFSGVVSFAASGLPAGATASFNPASVTGSGTTSMLISCAGWTTPGNYTVTITATSGSIQRTTTVGLSVTGFSISASPTSRTVSQGSSTTYTATVTDLNGYSATKTMSVTGLPNGVTATFSPSSLSGSGTSTLTLDVASNALRGTVTLSIRATSSVGSLYHTATVSLAVQ